MVPIRNLAYLAGLPEFGVKLKEALQSLGDAITTHLSQTNGNATGQPIPPPNISALQVTGQNGHHSIAITDNSNFYRGIQYHLEHDTSPQFTNPQPVSIGPSRNASLFLGSGPRYWRAASSYGLSAPSTWVYFGTAAQPKAVDAGGPIGPPAALASQGSGTGAKGVGLSGPGQQPFRSKTGQPPVR
jgi:hypothetical protein